MNKQYWAGRIQNTEPYIPGEQPKDRRAGKGENRPVRCCV